MRRVVLVLVGVVLASVASAQTKPIGAYSSDGAPPWVTFGGIDGDASAATLRAAAERSRLTGHRWVLQVGHHRHPLEDAGAVTADTLARAAAVGLRPYVDAMTYGEEWHERCQMGEFADLGLTAGHPACPSVVAGWFSRQHERAKAASGGLPILWITHVAHPAYRPVPAGVDYLALDPYPVDGQAWADFEPLLSLSEASTTLPIVLIPRWAYATGPFQGRGWERTSRPPSLDVIDGYARFAARPRVAAVWGFLWASRPTADLVGLRDMPATRAAVESSLRAAGLIR